MYFEKDETFDDLKDDALSQNDTQFRVDGSVSYIRKIEEDLNN